jgi:hypothetical protein
MTITHRASALTWHSPRTGQGYGRVEDEVMSAAETIAQTMTESLAWAELRRRYPDEWVCLVHVQHEPDGSIRSARVIGHHRSIKDALMQCSWSTVPVVAYAHTGGRKLRSPRIEMTHEIRDLVRPPR